jgi:hypothetical protein
MKMALWTMDDTWSGERDGVNREDVKRDNVPTCKRTLTAVVWWANRMSVTPLSGEPQ